RQPAAHLHETARVARHHAIGARALDVVELLTQDRRGDLRQAYRERAAEPAALIGARQIDQLDAGDSTEERTRAPRFRETTKQMAGIVIRHPALEARCHAVGAHDLDEELREFPRSPRELLRRPPTTGVVSEKAGVL